MTRAEMIAQAVRSAKPLPNGQWTPEGDFIPDDWQEFNRFMERARLTFTSLQQADNAHSQPAA